MHEETAYGPTSKEVVFVYRKKLEDLTPTMAEKIVDQVVRGIIKKRLDQNGIDHQGNNRIPKKVWEEPLYMKSKKGKKVPIKKVRIQDVISNVIMLKDTEGHPYRGVTPGKNHHVEIFEYKGEDGKVELGAEVVTMFEAVKRSRKGEEVIKRTHGLNTRFICSLAINEMVMLPDKNGKMDLYRVQKMSTTKQVYFRHHTASRIDNEKTLIRKQANLFDGYKVTVDPLGRVHRAND